MAIIIDEVRRVFTLQTKNSAYQMKADNQGVLLHTYYGEKTDESDKAPLCRLADRGFSGNPYEQGKKDRTYSLDSLPQEYSCFGTGDYRVSALKVQQADGSQADEVQTLAIRLKDPYTDLEVWLYYGVLEKLDVITRAVKIRNSGKAAVVLQKAASMNLDWECGNGFQWISFYGRHAMEQNLQRTEVHHGIQSIGSVRGMSSHQYGPFMMLCERGAGEHMGSCYGFSFVYSGEFLMEKDQIDRLRLVCGIHPDNFAWTMGGLGNGKRRQRSGTRQSCLRNIIH